jgi:Kef-type K+ transport system membrane component KefB
MRRFVAAYVLILLACGGGILLALQAGRHLQPVAALAAPAGIQHDTSASVSANDGIASGGAIGRLRENLHDPLSILLVQLILIILLARAFGALFARLGQPAVIGEMVAGFVLGPSVLGALSPGAFAFIFPVSSLGVLRMLSQVGVVLFMFVVGMEVDLRHLRGRAAAAALVSHAGIIFPYLLGVLFSLCIYEAFATPNVGFLAFALFMGIAMSLTAFPVLARIIDERGLAKTALGATALTCAAVQDVTAWTILAFVVAIVKSAGPGGSALTMALLVAFVALMLFAVQPVLRRLLGPGETGSNGPGRSAVVGILIMVFACGLFTEVIGMHALFGAFLAGVIIPPGYRWRTQVRERLESFSSAFLLPLFFAFTGLRTQIGLLNGWETLATCLGLICIATLGKLGATTLAARFTGMDWHDSFALGALMNTRGLVELIVLNIGLDLGILSPQVFTMMTIMALVTTAMTGPLLTLGDVLRRKTPLLASLRLTDPPPFRGG